MNLTYTKKDILNAIKSLETKAQAAKELSLEALTEEHRYSYKESYAQFKVRIDELLNMLNEVSNEPK